MYHLYNTSSIIKFNFETAIYITMKWDEKFLWIYKPNNNHAT